MPLNTEGFQQHFLHQQAGGFDVYSCIAPSVLVLAMVDRHKIYIVHKITAQNNTPA